LILLGLLAHLLKIKPQTTVKMLAPVRPGTVIKLTDRELKQDPKDLASSKIRGVYENTYKHPVFSSQVGPRETIKERVLAMSLYPNVVNAKYNKQDTGTYRSAGFAS
jgi:hypothetical protein